MSRTVARALYALLVLVWSSTWVTIEIGLLAYVPASEKRRELAWRREVDWRVNTLRALPGRSGDGVHFVALTLLLRELPAVTTSFISVLLPFGALAFGAQLEGETVTRTALGGAALVASGIAIAQWPRRSSTPTRAG